MKPNWFYDIVVSLLSLLSIILSQSFYHGTKYHLKDQVGRTPRNGRELFNFRHSSLRNVVEKTIDLLKKRFAFLRHEPFYVVKTQSNVILACCAIHNVLREEDLEDLCKDDEDIYEDEDDDDSPQEDNISIHQSTIWIAKRDALAELMLNEYH
ncbi:hypothetical protein Syun_003754 [Stephania yunnanensis]|uniref:DDE Tnp4 domain-containing protein n=1 Tax=Stephania yunnanensis TaxID=152371 RepID=A0AAP0L1Q3_9MAGN